MAAIAAIAIPIGPARAPIPTPSRFARFIIELTANASFPRISKTGAIAATTPAMMPIIVRTSGDNFESQLANCPIHPTTFSRAGARYPASCAPTVEIATDPMAFIVSSWSLN